jgi:aspartate carbamoyltransferase regulatory subunit
LSGRKFVLKDGQTIIYKGTLVTPASSFAFVGPVIRGTVPDDNVRPPLFEIGAGYPRDFEKGDTRFSERLKKALQQADLLSKIDVSNSPPPIERITHGWFGEKNGLRALVEVFPETFRLHRSARVHIHLRGGKDLDENHVVDVNATLISKDGKGTFSTKKVFPFHGSGWKTIYVLEMNPWGDTENSSGRVKPGRAKLSIEVFTRRVLDEQAKTYSEPIDRVKTDAIDVWIEPGQPLLPEMADKAMIRFQKAVRDSDWVKAIEYCSKKIKLKAKEYDSAEAFFEDVVPIDEIKKLSEFEVSGTGGSRNGEVNRYSCEIKLEVPDYKYSLNWRWSVIRKRSGWVIDFESKPLRIWKKHVVLEQELINDLWHQASDKLKKGLVIDLIPQSKEFVIGQPMLFDILIKNISDETLRYTQTSYMTNDPMIVKGPNDEQLLFIEGDCQTLIGPAFIEPHETITIVKDYDVRSQYHIVTPGRYSFQFIGFHDELFSNTIVVNIKEGKFSALEEITENLQKILPPDWTLSRSQRSKNMEDYVPGVAFISVHMVERYGKKGKSRGIELVLFIYLEQLDVDKEPVMEWLKYLGQSKYGPVYIGSFDAEKLWPDYKEQIANTLSIQLSNRNSVAPKWTPACVREL